MAQGLSSVVWKIVQGQKLEFADDASLGGHDDWANFETVLIEAGLQLYMQVDDVEICKQLLDEVPAGAGRLFLRLRDTNCLVLRHKAYVPGKGSSAFAMW